MEVVVWIQPSSRVTVSLNSVCYPLVYIWRMGDLRSCLHMDFVRVVQVFNYRPKTTARDSVELAGIRPRRDAYLFSTPVIEVDSPDMIVQNPRFCPSDATKSVVNVEMNKEVNSREQDY